MWVVILAPNLEFLPQYKALNHLCISFQNFAIGREGYGNVVFPGKTNIAGINFDDIVHFRRKEVTIYPDDGDKPAEGEGLNKKAQVGLFVDLLSIRLHQHI